MRKTLVALMAVVLVGCSGPVDDDQVTPEPTPTETVIPLPPVTQEPTGEASDPEVETVIETEAGPIVRASAETIAPDEAIMATMQCEPVSEETLDRIYRLHGESWTNAVQVEVGEGLTEGQLWWVIAGFTDTYPVGGAMVTSFPGGGNGWFYLGTSVESSRDGEEWNPWDNVRWDYERLARGQSALAKALDCLAG